MDKRSWRLTPATRVLLLLFLAVIPLGLTLPPAWGKENGPVEWAQVVILAAGCLIAVAAYFRGIGSKAAGRLFLSSVPFWLILIARELSWGRVFYPTGRGGFLPLSQLWYGAYVYPGITAAVLFTLAYVVIHDLHKKALFRLKNGGLPLLDAVVFLATALGADLAEHRLATVIGGRSVLFEELAETVAYFALVSIMVNMGFFAEFQPRAKRVWRQFGRS